MGDHIKTAFLHIRRVPYQALAAILSMTITFFVGTLLVLLAYSSSSVLQYFETKPQVIAFLKDEAKPDQISSLQRELESDSRIKNIQYVSKEQAREIFKETTIDNPLLSEFVSPKIFPASLEFSLSNLSFAEEVISEVKENITVSDVRFTASVGSENLSEVIGRLRTITQYIRAGGAVILGVLLFSSFLSLLVIVGMRVAARREEIEILQLIGATPGFIRMPFLIEAVFYTTIGGLLGWLFAVLLVLYTAPSLAGFFGEIPALPTEIADLLGLLGLILGGALGTAVILGLFGGLFALGRYLKL